MPKKAYSAVAKLKEKPLVWISCEITRPPFSRSASLEAGGLLAQFQRGQTPGPPQVTPIPSIGPHCFELRVDEKAAWWRIFVLVDSEAIVVLDVHQKTTNAIPKGVIRTCQARRDRYLKIKGGK
jgi:phage-related protein